MLFFILNPWCLGFAIEKPPTQVIEIKVTEKGFEPDIINGELDKLITLKITRITDSTCSKLVQIPSLKIKKKLPLNKTVSIKIGKLDRGEVRFGCGMNMMVGGIIYVK